ncbi:HlyD family type I secretion periplasmic adaptor subunit [Rhizobium lusitanum]|uniref:Membrane fusion protein (MFP) family protein n=1 Tax=Rhizobium lusitanum TaxID=293958 RepID=A0A7X0MGX2_9HYPH|nr:HlyD family type I secretion periplasmic adaptor subunit [Rhizobium lusitanum]MBB6488513.1 HlyD family type I secretion membrane fusion protein [Rhizobium lusitanum]
MMPSTTGSWREQLSLSTRAPAWAGYVAILGFGLTFGTWAAFAPISGAAVASGTIAAAGRNIQMQHLEGGMIRDIRVRDGDIVHKGDILVTLNDTAAKTQLNRLIKQWLTLTMQARRLEAERDGRGAFVATILRRLGPLDFNASEIIREERKMFTARLARFRSEQLILAQRLTQLGETKAGLVEQKIAIDKQSQVVKDELARKQGLLERGLINRSDYTELLRIDADLLGQAAAITSQQAATGSQIAEAREQIERLRSQRVEEAVTKLNEARNTLRDVEEQIAAAIGVLDRTVVHAPTDGIVVTSLYNTVGNVIAPGEKVMEILPTSKRPLVEARLKPTDIDVVRVGQPARLRFSALNARYTPEIEAVVQQVSADRLIDQATQQPYYRALLTITADLPASIPEEQLHPGMPVETFISTEDRTFFSYLMRPLLDSMRHAFVED